MEKVTRAFFSVGETVHHKNFDYRGVVVDVDPCFQGTDEWYEKVAKSRPPKEQPWYKVFVHESWVQTYVAERHLEADLSGHPIIHPLIEVYFSGFRNGIYLPRHAVN